MDIINRVKDFYEDQKFKVIKYIGEYKINQYDRDKRTFGDYYYENPDGVDCEKKIFMLSTKMARLVLPYALIGSVMYQPARTFKQHTLHALKNCGIFGLSGGTYAAISCTMAQIRGEDKIRDHAVAGFVASYALMYMKNVSPFQIVIYTFVASIGAACFKENNLAGLSCLPNFYWWFKPRELLDYDKFHSTFEDKLEGYFDYFGFMSRGRQFGTLEEDFEQFKADEDEVESAAVVQSS